MVAGKPTKYNDSMQRHPVSLAVWPYASKNMKPILSSTTFVTIMLSSQERRPESVTCCGPDENFKNNEMLMRWFAMLLNKHAQMRLRVDTNGYYQRGFRIYWKPDWGTTVRDDPASLHSRIMVAPPPCWKYSIVTFLGPDDMNVLHTLLLGWRPSLFISNFSASCFMFPKNSIFS